MYAKYCKYLLLFLKKILKEPFSIIFILVGLTAHPGLKKEGGTEHMSGSVSCKY